MVVLFILCTLQAVVQSPLGQNGASLSGKCTHSTYGPETSRNASAPSTLSFSNSRLNDHDPVSNYPREIFNEKSSDLVKDTSRIGFSTSDYELLNPSKEQLVKALLDSLKRPFVTSMLRNSTDSQPQPQHLTNRKDTVMKDPLKAFLKDINISSALALESSERTRRSIAMSSTNSLSTYFKILQAAADVFKGVLHSPPATFLLSRNPATADEIKNLCSTVQPCWDTDHPLQLIATQCSLLTAERAVRGVCCTPVTSSATPSTQPSSETNMTSDMEDVVPCHPFTPRPRARIIGGQQAGLCQFPFVAALYLDSKNKETLVCGSVILNSTAVLTAAHCVEGLGSISIHAGQLYTDTAIDDLVLGKSQKVRVSRVVIHPQYQGDPLYKADIAVLRLANELKLNDCVRPACLPPSDESPDPEALCFVSGWGTTSSLHRSQPPTLQWAPVKAYSRETCGDAFGDQAYALRSLTTGMLCAHTQAGADSCWGDSGGPLVCPTRKGDYKVFGLISHGDACAQQGVPGFYTDLAFYEDFIQGHPAFVNFTYRREGPPLPTLG